MDNNVVKFPAKKRAVGLDDVLKVLTDDKERIKTVFVIGFTNDNQVLLTHTPFTDEEVVFFAKVLDVYASQVIETIIDESSISFLPDGG